MKTIKRLEQKLDLYNKSSKAYNHKTLISSSKVLKVSGSMLTGLPLLMLPGNVLAQVNVTDVNQCWTGYSRAYFDIDGDSNPDFQVHFGYGYLDLHNSNIQVSGSYYYLDRLAYGADVCGNGLDPSFGFSADFIYGNAGNWLDDENPGYVGFSFLIAGMPHYGWMEFRITDYNPGPPRICLDRYAVATQPNTCIQAGVVDAPLTVPTLSEWGLITLALFLMTFGTVYIGRTQSMIAGSGSTRSIGSVFSKPPFVWSVLKKTLLATAGLAAVAGLITYMVYGSIAAVDILGTAVAGPLLAYLMHLIVVFEKERKRN